jgi:LysR family nitrogen assimilation transcriptional regulator
LVAQPAISRQVRLLEAELGLELFVRAGTGLELTPAGVLLQERMRPLLEQLDQAHADVVAQSGKLSGVVSIAVPTAAGALIMPGVLRTAKETLPDVKIKVFEDIGHLITERLLARQLSLGLLYDPVPHRELHAESLMIEPIHIFGCLGSRCSEKRAIAIEELAELPLILPQYPHNVRSLLEDAAVEYGIKLNVVFEVASSGVIRSLARQGAGYGILTAVTVQMDPNRRHLVSKPLQAPGMSMTLSIVRRTDMAKSQILIAVSDLIRAETKRLLRGGAWPSNAKFAASPG